MGAAAQHDLTRTGLYSLLEQRFFERALAASAVASRSGWVESPVGEIIDAYLGEWTVSRCEDRAFDVWLATLDTMTLLFCVEQDGAWRALASGRDQAAVDQWLDRLVEQLPEP